MSFFNFFKTSKPSPELFEALEELLIEADIGANLSVELVGRLRKKKWQKDISIDVLRQVLSQEIALQMSPFSIPFNPNFKGVVLVVGVNGSGKTTTIPKLLNVFKSCSFVAADTFRAAAVDQLKLWGEITSVKVYEKSGADPASLVFESMKSFETDVLIIDTAGRLQTQNNLMDELLKIKRSILKAKPETELDIILVLDGTVGQNALSQIAKFHNLLGVTGLVMTKLDGTARGGVILNAVLTYKIPIRGITFGESVEKFSALNIDKFSENLVKNILN